MLSKPVQITEEQASSEWRLGVLRFTRAWVDKQRDAGRARRRELWTAMLVKVERIKAHGRECWSDCQ